MGVKWSDALSAESPSDLELELERQEAERALEARFVVREVRDGLALVRAMADADAFARDWS